MPTQLDGVGFVAAGSGQWHAESQFMFSRYTREWDLPEALSLVYAAKKRAEVAPGVGKLETDLVVIFSHPPNTLHFNAGSPLVKELEEIYSKGREKRDEATVGNTKKSESSLKIFPRRRHHPQPSRRMKLNQILKSNICYCRPLIRLSIVALILP